MKVLIYGSREFGVFLKKLVCECGHEFVGFVDDFNEGKEIIGPYALAREKFLCQDYGMVNGIGYNDLNARKIVTEKIRNDGYALPNIIHKTAYLAGNVSLGDGCIIMARVLIDFDSKIGDGVVIWPGAVVNHECYIDSNTFISPNATICGVSRIGANCFIGAAAVVIDHATVDDNSFIKANSLYK